MGNLIFLLLLPTVATSFLPLTSYFIMKTSPARRTSSVAYDDQTHGPKYSFYGRDELPNSSIASALPSNHHDDSKPMFTFGILTDIQYAPIPDGHSYNGTPRYYRHAITAAEYAARHFQEEKVQCVLNLGDIIDGKCADIERYGGGSFEDEKKMETDNRRQQAVDDVLQALGSYTYGRFVHTYGNHELYNLSRKDLCKKLKIPFTLEATGDLVGYFSHQIHSQTYAETKETDKSMTCVQKKLRFLVLDSYDICVLDRCPKESHKYRQAHDILSANNHNYPHNENSPDGLEGLSKRFVAFGGGIDIPQLEWFEKSLQSAKENGERVIVVSHQPIHPGSSWPTCLMWNYLEVLSIMRRNKEVIIASFSGHAHKGGYVRDDSGIHFRTLEAVLESPDPIRTYGICDLWDDKLVIRGSGDCVSDVYDLDHLTTYHENI